MLDRMEAMKYRWYLTSDPNADGLFTISDVWLWIKWFYFAPGDILIYVATQVGLGTFFELGPHSYGNWFSAIVGIPFAFIFGLALLLCLGFVFSGSARAQ